MTTFQNVFFYNKATSNLALGPPQLGGDAGGNVDDFFSPLRPSLLPPQCGPRPLFYISYNLDLLSQVEA
jgi:hypothetical protein